MEMPVGEMQQRFAEAMAAAERGEPVILTRDGEPVLKLVQADRVSRIPTEEEAARTRRAMGFEDGEEVWPAEFDDPAFSRKLLGLE